MTHYNTRYNDPSESVNDAAACADIMSYLTPAQYSILVDMTAHPEVTCRSIDVALHFAGIQGYPVFAWIRTHRPEQYQAWFDALLD